MNFANEYNGYAERLQDELPSIERFALSISPLLTHGLCEHVFSSVTTYFDDVHKHESKGSISNLENLLDKLLDKYNNPHNNNEQWFKDDLRYLRNRFNNGADNQICGEELLWIFDESKWPKNPEICRDIVRIKDQIQKSYLDGVLQGCYIHNDKLIGIFVKHLDPNKYEDFLSVFVHEVFHALHHFYLDNSGCSEILSEYYQVVVLESLATYFQIKYLEHKEYLTKVEELKSSILCHSPIFYPYSGVQRLFWEDNLFNDVLDLTRDDFEQALRQLVSKHDADIILEKKDFESSDDCIKNVKKRTNTIPVSGRLLDVEFPDYSNNKIDTALDVLRSIFDIALIFANSEIDDSNIIVNGKDIHLFIVAQGRSYEIESKRGHVYAPQKNFPKMFDVHPNDIIFSCQDSQIKSINIALESAKKTYGVEDGLRIDCLYSELSIPLDITPYRSTIAGTTAFDKNGNLKQAGYIHHLEAWIAMLFMREIKKLGNKPR